MKHILERAIVRIVGVPKRVWPMPHIGGDRFAAGHSIATLDAAARVSSARRGICARCHASVGIKGSCHDGKTCDVIGRVHDIPPGERKIVEIEGRSIGVFNILGAFYALRNSCAHQGAPICKGRLIGLTTAPAPNVLEYSRPGEIVC